MCCPLDTPPTSPSPDNPLTMNNCCSKTMKSPSIKKSVRFNSCVWVVPMHRPSDEDAKHIWYDISELMAFRREGREVAHSMRKGIDLPTRDASRGFEATALHRQRQRHLSIKCTLSAFRKGMNANDIACVAEKCNEWSHKNAFVQACHDYAAVYQPDLVAMIPELNSLPGPEFPAVWVSSDKRRVSVDEIDTKRRVRQRSC